MQQLVFPQQKEKEKKTHEQMTILQFLLQRRKFGRILGIFNTVYCQTAAVQRMMLVKSMMKFVQGVARSTINNEWTS